MNGKLIREATLADIPAMAQVTAHGFIVVDEATGKVAATCTCKRLGKGRNRIAKQESWGKDAGKDMEQPAEQVDRVDVDRPVEGLGGGRGI